MDDVQRAAHNVSRDLTHLALALEHENYPLALSCAKRGRRNLTLLTRALAAEIDATTQEGTSE